MLYIATGKPAHLGCKFLSDVSVVNRPIVVEMLVIAVLFCVVSRDNAGWGDLIDWRSLTPIKLIMSHLTAVNIRIHE